MLVVSGCDASPLLDVTILALDHVAVAVVVGVECDRPATSRSAALAVSFLVVGFRDHSLDAAGAQMAADRAGRVGLVAADRVRSGSWSANVASDFQLRHQRQEHR